MKLFALALTALLPCLAASSDADSAKSMGSPNAPIRIEVFSDFECPACKGLHEQILPLVIQGLRDTRQGIPGEPRVSASHA